MSAVLSFILLISIHRDVQHRIHDEIDHVIGQDHTPKMSQLSALVYTSAVMKEVLRFAPVGPLGELSEVSITYSNSVDCCCQFCL